MRYVRDFIKWILNPNNRRIAFKYFRIGLEMGREVSRYRKENKGLEYTALKLMECTDGLNASQHKGIAASIKKKDRGPLKNLSAAIDCDNGEYSVGYGGSRVSYNAKDKGFKVLLGSKF